MSCEYCDRDRSTTYTIHVGIGDTDASVKFGFCSRECLTAWSSPVMDYGATTVSGQPVQ